MDEPVNLIVLSTGFVIGFLYVCFSWRGKQAAGSAVKDDPRIRGFIWGLTSAGIIVIGDWQKFLQMAYGEPVVHFSRAALLGYYLGGFIGGTIITIAGLAIKIGYDSSRTNAAHRNIFTEEGFSPILEFLLYGHTVFQERAARTIEKYKSSAATTNAHLDQLQAIVAEKTLEVEVLNGKISRRRKIQTETSDILINAIDGYLSFIIKKLDERTVCRGLLRNIISITAYYVGANATNINANYMLAEHRRNLTDADIAEAKFRYGDSSRYITFLSLKEYARKGTNIIRLPVEPVHDQHDWQDRTLPGAPDAFLRREPVYCDKHNIDFGREVPPEVRRSQQRYFSTQSFDAIVSLPIMPALGYNSGSAPIGVLNIDLLWDSGENSSFDFDFHLAELAALLLPCTSLLADILGADESGLRSMQ